MAYFGVLSLQLVLSSRRLLFSIKFKGLFPVLASKATDLDGFSLEFITMSWDFFLKHDIMSTFQASLRNEIVNVIISKTYIALMANEDNAKWKTIDPMTHKPNYKPL